jgi:peptide/nickel transport system permease protein
MFLRRLAHRRTALFGLIVVMLVVVAALGAPWIAAYDPTEQAITDRLKPPGSLDAAGRPHVLGTDHLGRDILARVLYGTRPALMVGFAAVAISGVLGMMVGLFSSYFGGASTTSSCGSPTSSWPSRSFCWPSLSSVYWDRACP